MSRLLAGAFPFLVSVSALAQQAKEPAIEHASPLAIILFLILFLGSGVAYAVYLWWTHKKSSKEVDK